MLSLKKDHQNLERLAADFFLSVREPAVSQRFIQKTGVSARKSERWQPWWYYVSISLEELYILLLIFFPFFYSITLYL